MVSSRLVPPGWIDSVEIVEYAKNGYSQSSQTKIILGVILGGPSKFWEILQNSRNFSFQFGYSRYSIPGIDPISLFLRPAFYLTLLADSGILIYNIFKFHKNFLKYLANFQNALENSKNTEKQYNFRYYLVIYNQLYYFLFFSFS